MKSSLVVPVGVIALCAGLATTQESLTVNFELPDVRGKLIRVTDLGARYALLVYQGIP
jgi:hypothetical protein